MKPTKETKHVCQHCNKPIVSIGSSRKTGRPFDDWKSRKYHSKCYRVITHLENLLLIYNDNKDLILAQALAQALAYIKTTRKEKITIRHYVPFLYYAYVLIYNVLYALDPCDHVH